MTSPTRTRCRDLRRGRWRCSSPTSPARWSASPSYTRALAGAETNVATGLARLGHRAGWIGRVGDDPFGRFALAELAAAGIDTTHVSSTPTPPPASSSRARPAAATRRSSTSGATPPAAGWRLGPGPGCLRRRRPAPARHRDPAGPVGQHPGLRLPRRRRGPRRGRHRLLRPQPAAECCGRRPQEMVRGDSTRWPRAPTGCCPGSRGQRCSPARRTPHGIAAVLPGARGASVVVIKDGAARRQPSITAEGRIDQPVFPVAGRRHCRRGRRFRRRLDQRPPRRALPAARRLRRAAAVGALATTSPGDKDGLPDRAAAARTHVVGRPLAGHSGRRRDGWHVTADRPRPDPARRTPSSHRGRGAAAPTGSRSAPRWSSATACRARRRSSPPPAGRRCSPT